MITPGHVWRVYRGRWRVSCLVRRRRRICCRQSCAGRLGGVVFRHGRWRLGNRRWAGAGLDRGRRSRWLRFTCNVSGADEVCPARGCGAIRGRCPASRGGPGAPGRRGSMRDGRSAGDAFEQVIGQVRAGLRGCSRSGGILILKTSSR